MAMDLWLANCLCVVCGRVWVACVYVRVRLFVETNLIKNLLLLLPCCEENKVYSLTGSQNWFNWRCWWLLPVGAALRGGAGWAGCGTVEYRLGGSKKKINLLILLLVCCCLLIQIQTENRN